MNSITGQRGFTHMYIYGWNVPVISDRSQNNFKQIHFQKLEVFTFQITFHTHCYEPFHLDKHITYKGVDVNQPLNCKWVTGSLVDADRSGFSLKSELKYLLCVKVASDRCGLEDGAATSQSLWSRNRLCTGVLYCPYIRTWKLWNLP